LASAPPVWPVDVAYTLNCPLPAQSACRLAVVASSLEDLRRKLDHALTRLADPQTTRIRDRSGIYYFASPLAPQGKLAFLFPGEGSQYINMLADLCIHFPDVRTWFDQIDRAFLQHKRNFLPGQAIFPPPGSEAEAERLLWQMDCGTEAVFTASQALLDLLGRLEIRPQAVAGHSTGEYSALVAGGALRMGEPAHQLEEILVLNTVFEEARQQGEIPTGVLMAAGTPDRQRVQALVNASRGRLLVAMDNCPHQVVLCGDEADISRAADEMKADGVICTLLPFRRAYHTPGFAPFCRRLEAFFAKLDVVPPQIPVYSAAVARRLPDDPQEIRRLAAWQWTMPVKFQDTVEAMYADGCRIFVEVGPRSNLTGFVEDILKGRPFLAVPANVHHRSGISQLNHLIGLLASHGVTVNLEYLYTRRQPQRLELETPGRQPVAGPLDEVGMKVPVGLPVLDLDPDVAQRFARPPAGQTTLHASPEMNGDSGNGFPGGGNGYSPYEHSGNGYSREGASVGAASHQRAGDVMGAYFQTMERFLALQREVMAAFLGAPSSAVGTTALPLAEQAASHRVETQPQLSETDPASADTGRSSVPPKETTDLATPPAPAAPPQAPPTPTQDLQAGESGVALETLTHRLLRLVSERTGYPPQMLGLDLNIESDLGIDSIKRVEIYGALHRQLGRGEALDMEGLGRLKTLREITAFLSAAYSGNGHAESAWLAVEADADANPPAEQNISFGVEADTRRPAHLTFPFLRQVLSHTPGEVLEVLCELDLDQDLFLKDHTLGRRISTADPDLLALPLVPLTIGVEIMAEVAAALAPGRFLVELKNIHSFRWITLEEGHLPLLVTARHKPGEGVVVEVQVRELPGAALPPDDSAVETSPPTNGILMDAVAIFADQPRQFTAASPFSLQEETTPPQPQRFYELEMFHGPTFQGLVSVDRSGDDGLTATLASLPIGNMFRSMPQPDLLADPLLLDCAGQMVAYWTGEHLQGGPYVFFPFHLASLQLFEGRRPAGETVECRVRAQLLGRWQVQADIELVSMHGQVLARLQGWEDRCFEIPSDLYHLRVSPITTYVSNPWPEAAGSLLDPDAFHICRLESLSADFLTANGQIWLRVLAALTLSREERALWKSLKGPGLRRVEWLLGRACAKDAVRRYLRKQYGLELCPADVEILPDASGRPQARGVWSSQVDQPPLVSIAHSGGVAAAVAGSAAHAKGIGIDLEVDRRLERDAWDMVFTDQERDFLNGLEAQAAEEWSLHLWCAKEATVKALGQGIGGRWKDLAMQQADLLAGRIWLGLTGSLAEELAWRPGRVIETFSVREGNRTSACARIELE
jgi:malonyl CoA-acyl carrier protein transacylase/4'-phosphopantetheinyl transferase EntD